MSTASTPRPSTVIHNVLYTLSIPERVLRQLAAWLGSLLLPLVQLLPAPLRRGKFYQLVLLRQIRILTDTVGQAHMFRGEQQLEGAAAVRLGVGGVLDNAMILGLQVSPVWILLAATDVCEGARSYVNHLARELHTAGVMPEGSLYGVDDVLKGLAQLADRASDSLDMPPINLHEMRASVAHLRADLKEVTGSSVRLADVNALGHRLLELKKNGHGSLLALSTAAAMGSVQTAGKILVGTAAGACATAAFLGAQLKETLAGYSTSLNSLQEMGLRKALHSFLLPIRRSEHRLFDRRFLTITEILLSFGKLRSATWRRPSR
jgi:hypothetical protein